MPTPHCMFGPKSAQRETGVAVSRIPSQEDSTKMSAYAQEDAGRMENYKSKIKSVARSKGVDASIIAGIISRESRAGSPHSGMVNGWGDNGNAFGLMQIDKRWHNPRGAWDSEEHLRQGVDILNGCIGEIRQKFPGWSSQQQLRGGLAAYNMGASNVESYDRVDAKTTGRDYSRDVLERAQWYKSHGY